MINQSIGAGSSNIQIGLNYGNIQITQIISGTQQWKDLLDKKRYLEDLLKYTPFDEFEKRLGFSKELTELNQLIEAFRISSIRLAEEVLLYTKISTVRLDLAKDLLKQSKFLELYRYMIGEATAIISEQEILIQSNDKDNTPSKFNDSLKSNAAEFLILAQSCEALTRSLNPPVNVKEDAEKYFLLSIKSCRFFSNLLEYGNHLFGKSRLKESLIWFEAAQKISNSSIQRADAIGNIATVNLHLGEFQNVEVDFLSAIHIYEEVEKNTEDAKLLEQTRNGKFVALSNLSQLYLHQLAFEKATDIYEQLIKDTEGEKFSYTIANNLGLAFLFKYSLDDAERYFLLALSQIRSLSEKQNINMKLEIALCITNLGTVYQQREDFNDAIKKFEESIKLIRPLLDDDPSGFQALGAALNNIGDCQSRTLQWNESEKNLKEALIIREKLAATQDSMRYSSDLAMTLNNLGVHYIMRESYQLAKDFLLRSLVISKTQYAKNPKEVQHFVANTYNNLGIAFAELKDYRSSEEYYEKALGLSYELLRINDVVYFPLHLMVVYGMTLMYYKKKERNRSVQYAQMCMNLLKMIGGESDEKFRDCLEIEQYWATETRF